MGSTEKNGEGGRHALACYVTENLADMGMVTAAKVCDAKKGGRRNEPI